MGTRYSHLSLEERCRLRGLVEMQALESIPRDPWNNEYTYIKEGNNPVITSYGPDGTSGGGDDISSKDAEPAK